MAEALDGQSDTTPDRADIESNWTETFESFDALELNEDLLRGIYDFGFEKPSASQQKCLLPLVRGHDTICQVYSGSGRTATIAIGVLQRIDVKNSSCQALILAPTRELAQQIEKVVLQLGKFMQPQCLVCIGGTNQRDEILKLEEGVHIVVGTPACVCSYIDRRVLRVTDIKMLVLDEADEMLLRGFNPSIDDVFKFMPQNVQVCLFSATMPGEVLGIAKRFMQEPVRIEGRYPLQSLENVMQFYRVAESDEGKFDTLNGLKDAINSHITIIYVSNSLKADWLFDKMANMGCNVARVHEDMPSKLCGKTMLEFRSGAFRVVVVSLAYSVDVVQVSLVIHFDLPCSGDRYVRSISRAGRFGGTGVAINLVTVDDLPALKELQMFCRVPIEDMPANVADFIS